MITLLQISDLHFGKEAARLFDDPDLLCKSVCEAVAGDFNEDDTKLLVVSGDLVYKNRTQGYRIARRTIQGLARSLDIPRENIYICPGNHDIRIHSKNPFESYNKTVHSITGESHWLCGTKGCATRDYGNYSIIQLNSVYHLNHTYGLIDMKAFNEMRIDRLSKPRIAFVHHNPVGMTEEDCSAIRNGYEFMVALSQGEVNLLLHGHQHFLGVLPFGCGQVTVGAGSLNYTSRLPNQFNLIKISNDQIHLHRFLHVVDEPTSGGMGGWKRMTVQDVQ